MTDQPVSALADMLAGMDPVLDDQAYVFASSSGEPEFQSPFAIIVEDEGKTFVRPADEGDSQPKFSRMTLQVHSDLEGVGLTAAVSSALANAGIACNVIAAFHHDHLFVPWDHRGEALQILKDLSDNARRKV